MCYQIIEIPAGSYDAIEQLGTKEKFWYNDKQDNTKKIFKIGRFGTGENWAEKATGELAKLLRLPCAEYNFAIWNGKEGVLSPLFLPENARLVHGNERLARIIDDYPQHKSYKVRDHKLLTVLAVIRAALLPVGYEGNRIIQKPIDLFIGYLMFDCWISNPDRHHENWGLIINGIDNTAHLAPTYDHASGLGCRVSDEDRLERLHTNDTRYNIDAFVRKTKSAFYDDKLAQLKTIDAFNTAARYNRPAADYWLNELESISQDDIENIFRRIPETLISQPAIEFALAILKSNKHRLIESFRND